MTIESILYIVSICPIVWILPGDKEMKGKLELRHQFKSTSKRLFNFVDFMIMDEFSGVSFGFYFYNCM